MTASREQAKALLDAVEEIPLTRLSVSPSEARKTIAAGPLRELTLSIEQYGVREPLLVRPRGLDGLGAAGVFEIVSGQRRYLASGLAGKLTCPCLVRALTDDEAAEIRLISNLQREDLPALEEAAAFAELRDRAGSIAAVAAKVGKDIAYVTKRLKLVDLGELGRKALAAGILTVDHALLLARLGKDEQAAALKWCIDYSAGAKTTAEKVVDDRIAIGLESRGGHHQWEPQSVQRLKEHIEQHSGRKLARAPWDLDDATLAPEAGACSACPSNTKSNTSLFGDLDIEAATCADGQCFEAKRAAFVQLQWNHETTKLQATPPLSVSWKISTVKPRWARDGKGPDLKQVFKYGQWLDVKKGSCAHVSTAVTVDWSDASDRGYMGSGRKQSKPGEVVLVCVAEKCKTHPKGWESLKPAATKAAAALRDPAAEARAKATAEHREKHEKAIRMDIFAALLPKLDARVALQVLNDELYNGIRARADAKKQFAQASPEQIECIVALDDVLICECLDVDGERLEDRAGVARDRKRLWDFAKRFGVDADPIAAAHFWKNGSIAPASDVLYPENAAWPKDPKKTPKQVMREVVDAAAKGRLKKLKLPGKSAKKTPAKKGGAK